jgi:hypothetical protein
VTGNRLQQNQTAKTQQQNQKLKQKREEKPEERNCHQPQIVQIITDDSALTP